MSTSKILCPKCGTRMATITSSGIVRPQPGHLVTRLYALYALLQCGACGDERKVRYPEERMAA